MKLSKLIPMVVGAAIVAGGMSVWAEDAPAKKGCEACATRGTSKLQAMDANKDGQVSQDEFKAFCAEQLKKMQESGKTIDADQFNAKMTERFTAMDADKSGSVSGAEMSKCQCRGMKAEGASAGSGCGGCGGKAPEAAAK